MLFENSSKDLVIKVLSEEWPLSAREIYNRVLKHGEKNISYQAIHKLLNSLLEKEILIKEENKYSINLNWIEQTQLFLSQLNINLKEGKNLPLNQQFIFSTIYEVDKFLVEMCNLLKPLKTDEMALQWVHFWIPLFVSRDTYKEMSNLIVNSNFYSITKSDSKIDKWCSNFWKDLGVKEKVGVDFGFELSFFVFKDVIVQVFYPTEIKKLLDNFYNSVEDPTKLDLDQFFKTVFEKKTRIPVLISHNKEVAGELLNQIKSVFD